MIRGFRRRRKSRKVRHALAEAIEESKALKAIEAGLEKSDGRPIGLRALTIKLELEAAGFELTRRED